MRGPAGPPRACSGGAVSLVPSAGNRSRSAPACSGRPRLGPPRPGLALGPLGRLGDLGRHPGDGGDDHQLVLGHVGAHARGQVQVAHPDAFADGHAGDVDFDGAGDAVRGGVHGERGQRLLDQALLLLHRLGLADQEDGHFGGDHLVATDDLEVDVGDGVAHRVALKHPGQGQVAVGADPKLEQLVGARVTGQGVAQVAAVHRHGDGGGAVAVHHGRDAPCRPQPAGFARTGRPARFGYQGDLCHRAALAPRPGIRTLKL